MRTPSTAHRSRTASPACASVAGAATPTASGLPSAQQLAVSALDALPSPCAPESRAGAVSTPQRQAAWVDVCEFQICEDPRDPTPLKLSFLTPLRSRTPRRTPLPHLRTSSRAHPQPSPLSLPTTHSVAPAGSPITGAAMSEGAEALIQAVPCGGSSGDGNSDGGSSGGGSSGGTAAEGVGVQSDVSGLVAARMGLMDEMVRAQQRRAQRQQQQQQQSAGEHSQVGQTSEFSLCRNG